ncbi:MAG: hypothetical protein JW881_21990 [Spirochaetales bacterium]|nr:hypothetical protein [Spirochaetales bacterium]
MEKYLFIDIETTGLDTNKNGIIQIAGIIEINRNICEKFNFHVKPFASDIIDPEALRINNVAIDAFINDGRYIDPVAVHGKLIAVFSRYIDKFDKKDKFHLVGYNSLAFDVPFLRSWFYKCGDTYFGSWFFTPSIDIMPVWAYLLAAERDRLPDFKLSTVAAHCGIDIDTIQFHDAMQDVEVTRELYHAIGGL